MNALLISWNLIIFSTRLKRGSVGTDPQKSKSQQSPSSSTTVSNREGHLYAQLSFSRTSPELMTRVWRKALLAKMARKGIPTCFIRWVRGFLSDRKAFVSWQGASNRKRTISEELPRGSVLATLLWLIYMDDLLHSNHQSFLVFTRATLC